MTMRCSHFRMVENSTDVRASQLQTLRSVIIQPGINIKSRDFFEPFLRDANTRCAAFICRIDVWGILSHINHDRDDQSLALRYWNSILGSFHSLFLCLLPASNFIPKKKFASQFGRGGDKHNPPPITITNQAEFITKKERKKKTGPIGEGWGRAGVNFILRGYDQSDVKGYKRSVIETTK